MKLGDALCALSLALLATLGGPLARAQDAAPPPCPAADEIQPQQLYGLWRFRLWPEGGSEAAPSAGGSVLFGRHPEYPGSVRGELLRSGASGGPPVQVAGDVTDGEFNLDESADGVSMDAVWTGTPQDCGQTIRGVRRPAEGRPDATGPLQFLLQKTPGWR